MGRLVLALPDGTSLDIPLDRERVTIGRRADNDVCLPYPAVSGEHAAIVTILDDSFLEDLNSTNGTLVNGKPIAKHFLRDGDEIDIGRQKLVYFSGDGAVAAGGDAPVRSGRTLRNPRARKPTGALEDMKPLGPAPGEPAGVEPGRSEPFQDASAALPRPFAPPPGRAMLADLAALLGAPDPVRAADTAAATVEAGSSGAPRAAAAAGAVEEGPRVRVTSGASEGRVVAMSGDELVIGRVGECIVVVRRSGEGFRLVPLEGEGTSTVNGAKVAAEGAELRDGDAIEVAGTRLVFAVR